MMKLTHRNSLALLASACLLALPACSAEEGVSDDAASAEASAQTLLGLISDNGELSSVEALLVDSGMAETFDGAAAYTVFAPTDAALAELGEDFTGEAARPALLAMLRDQIVPGYLTVEDITAAVETKAGTVEMQTMGNTPLSFSLVDGELMVATPDGAASAAIGAQMRGANGVVIPVQSVLKQVAPAP